VRTVLVIGIGAGDPEHLTLQAVRALQRVDAFFVVDKGPVAASLVALRRRIVAEHVPAGSYRWVQTPDPPRDRQSSAYVEAVDDWRSRRADAYERLLADELGADETGAFLVWGDPSLYDSTLGALTQVRERGAVAFEVEVVAGISSVSALAARHATSLNRVGRPVLLTTGRRVAGDGLPDGVDDVAVLLDPHSAALDAADADDEVFWGAYVSTPDELLVHGRAGEVAGEIRRQRAAALERHGWVMDVTLLRRRRP